MYVINHSTCHCVKTISAAVSSPVKLPIAREHGMPAEYDKTSVAKAEIKKSADRHADRDHNREEMVTDNYNRNKG